MFVIHAIFKMVLLLRGKNICQFPSIGGELEKMNLQVEFVYKYKLHEQDFGYFSKFEYCFPAEGSLH